ncbi:hypothetical protein PQX77_006571 [Marasmius sp. AFHP31]|nr:hypothetical protein PQX77_006571 [Marasmius sp. AFHP31]
MSKAAKIRSITDLPHTTHDSILRDLSFNDHYAYSQVNRAANEAVKGFSKKAHRVERVLSRFFDPEDIRRFRILQYHVGFLVSGSTALSFFEREVYDNSDLDVYVDLQYAIFIADFLERSGYIYQPYQTDFRHQRDKYPDELDDAINQFFQELDELGREELSWNRYPWGGVVDVLRFRRGEREVQIILCEGSPLGVILGFHSTVVMNLISYSHAISLYPQSTFRDRVSLLNSPSTEEVGTRNYTDAIKKYQKRGWKMIDSGSGCNVLSRHSDLNMFVRRVGDRQCWTIPLDPVTDFVTEGPLQLGRSESLFEQSWRLMYSSSGRASLREGISLLEVRVLGRSYCVERETAAAIRQTSIWRALERWAGSGTKPLEMNELDDPTLRDLVECLIDKVYRECNDKGQPAERARELLLTAFTTDDALDILSPLPPQRLPNAYGVRLLYEMLRGVLENFKHVPSVSCIFRPNSYGLMWTNVKVSIPYRMSLGSAVNRYTPPLETVIPVERLKRELKVFKVNLQLNWPRCTPPCPSSPNHHTTTIAIYPHLMPTVSLEQAFTAFGFSPAQASRMAAENRAVNGLDGGFGYYPDESNTMQDEEDGDKVDILDLAEEERRKGDLDKAVEVLVFALASCKGNSNMIVVELKAHVRLAHVYHEMKELAKASKEFQEAYDLHQDWMTDNDRELHPISYLPLWAECCDKLSQPKKAVRLREQYTKMIERYRGHWSAEELSDLDE